jgi:ferredoxin
MDGPLAVAIAGEIPAEAVPAAADAAAACPVEAIRLEE